MLPHAARPIRFWVASRPETFGLSAAGPGILTEPDYRVTGKDHRVSGRLEGAAQQFGGLA
jgi:hypothetical protein